MKFSIYLGDIADAPAEAVCTSTNPRLSLLMGSGASVRERGGPDVLRACEALLAKQPPLQPGSAHATTAGMLPHKIAIHCVASDAAHHSSETIVQLCVTHALALADAAGCVTVAMPVFATGHARLRFTAAARAMARAALDYATRVREVKFVTKDAERVEDLRKVLQEIAGTRIDVERAAEAESEPDSPWSDEYSLDLP